MGVNHEIPKRQRQKAGYRKGLAALVIVIPAAQIY